MKTAGSTSSLVASEQLGGFTVIDVPDDETAKMWVGKLAQGCGWPQEVRRFGSVPDL